MALELSQQADQEFRLPVPMDAFGFISHPGTIDQYLSLVSEHIENRSEVSVFYHNQHTIYSYFTNDRLKRCYENTVVMADGMCVILLCRLSGYTLNRTHRLTYVDFIMPLMQLAQRRKWRVFHVGQKPAVLEKALLTIRSQIPGITIEGHDGYFDQSAQGSESKQVIQKINAFSTDLLLIGFGTPQQEYWVDAHRDQINAPVVLTCGACMEYVAGAVRTPPRWMGRMGLEWSFRLMESPRRFGYRYTIQTLKLGLMLSKHWYRQRFSPHHK